MTEWLQAEARRLQAAFPDLEHTDGGLWFRLPTYGVPPGWSESEVELAIQLPQGMPAQDPYGFWIRPAVTLNDGCAPSNSSGPVEVPGLGSGWLQFSWAPEGWRWGASPGEGPGMVEFVRSVGRRMRELN